MQPIPIKTKIKFLSSSTINKIAAGEVIERPASVVKELIENSIDAGSTKINIILERAGKNLIIISDDGNGMLPEELEIAIQRHTTSKLDEDDLLNIHTFGFRGEAMPSIGAISKMTITSKDKQADKAYKIQIIGGEIKPIVPAIHNEGTKIEIRDLFFATPARLKFLRSDKTEASACIDIIKRIALAHPHISFSLTLDDKKILKVDGFSGELQDVLKKRIQKIVGKDFIENAAYINYHEADVSLFGFTSLPTFNRASSDDQYLFINNRPVKDKLLNVALRVAYNDYLARERYPVTALFIQINPQLVDVNVHPAKSEVRFHDPNLIRNLLISAIKSGLENVSHKVSTTTATTALGFFNTKSPSPNYRPSSNLNFANSKPADPQITDKILADNKTNFKAFAPSEVNNASINAVLIDSIPPAAAVVEPQIIDQENIFPLGAAKAQLHSTYLISQTKDSIIIVDQHAAHERLAYEKIKETIKHNGLIKQRLLMPEIVELPDEKRAELLDENKAELSKFALTIEKFGEKSIIVSEIPSLVGDINVKQLINDLADHLAESGENIQLIKLIEHVTETYACHYSIRAGRSLSVQEMNELLRQMEKTPYSGQCNHGRPTYVELKLKDIEKLFGRR